MMSLRTCRRSKRKSGAQWHTSTRAREARGVVEGSEWVTGRMASPDGTSDAAGVLKRPRRHRAKGTDLGFTDDGFASEAPREQRGVHRDLLDSVGFCDNLG